MNFAMPRIGRKAPEVASLLAILGLLWVIAGCGRSSDGAALNSDANGFLCMDCQAKFYTDRQIFANHCPQCQKGNVEMVVGFECPADHTVTYGPRGKGSVACRECGKVTAALIIPSESELKEWGAVKRTAKEVGVE